MRHRGYVLVGPFVALVLTACGPQQQAPAPAAPAAQPAPSAAQPAQPATQPAKPAAEVPKPAAQPQKEAKPAAAPKERLRMIFGSSSAGSSYYVLAVAVAKLWNSKVPEVEVTNSEGGGCVDHLRRMDQGQFQIGVACPDVTYLAWHGQEQFQGKESRTQRFIAVLTQAVEAWTVRKDTSIAGLAQLGGKDWSPGMKGSGTENLTKGVFELLGIKPRYYSAGVTDMIQAAKDKRIVGFAKLQAGVTIIDSATQEVNITTPLDMLGFTEEQAQKVQEKFPYYRVITLKKDQLASGFPSQDVRVISRGVGVAVVKDVPEDVAYKMTKISVEDNAAKDGGVQATAYPAMKGMDLAQATLDLVLTPLHAGAVRYYKELGKDVKKEQLPPELR